MPFFVAIILAHGLRTIEFAVDNEFLFTPIGSQGLMDRQKVRELCLLVLDLSKVDRGAIV